MKTKFFQTCVGVSLMLFSLGFFFNSIQTATASPTPENFFQTGGNQIGKYMMQVYLSAQGTKYTLVWDTESGKSKVYELVGYTWLPGNNKGLPENPLGN